MELLDYFNEKMEPLGVATREEVHQKGYWHKTFHCWIIWQKNNKNYILFQKRSLLKDNSPGKFDISAAGHVLAGENIEDGSRELQEELGIDFKYEDLIFVKIFKDEDVTPKQANREFCYTYFLIHEQPLDTFQVQVEEVSGLLALEIDIAKDLIEDKLDSVESTLYTWTNDKQVSTESYTLQKNDLIKRTDDYYLYIFEKAEMYLNIHRIQKKMNTKDWTLEPGLLRSSFPTWIPWLKGTIESIWFEIEIEHEWWTTQQYDAYLHFLKLPDTALEQVREALNQFYHQKLVEKQIGETDFDNILDTIHWEESLICIPPHQQSKNHYIFFLPTLNLNYTDNENQFDDIMLLFRNGQIILTREFNDIWIWPKWFEYLELGDLEF